LYEPNGQPFRDVEEVQLGRTDPGTGGFVVRAEDLVPGVYELDVIAPPLSGVSVTARAEVAPLLLSDNEASNPGDATAGGRLTRALVGAERRVAVTGRGARPWHATVRVRFLLREGRPFGDGADVTVVPGGRTVVAPQRPPQLALPDGFAPLVELRVHAGVGADAVRRVVPQP